MVIGINLAVMPKTNIGTKVIGKLGVLNVRQTQFVMEEQLPHVKTVTNITFRNTPMADRFVVRIRNISQRKAPNVANVRKMQFATEQRIGNVKKVMKNGIVKNTGVTIRADVRKSVLNHLPYI